jgi:hypothetical protein
MVKIKKAKIKDGLFLEVEYSEDLQDHKKKETKLSCTIPVHNDLLNAVGKLDKHLAILCDELYPKKGTDIEKWDGAEAYTAKGFSIGGNDEHEGVTISGQKDVEFGIVNLNTPFQKYESSDYKYMRDLSADIQTCIFEVEEYLFNGKRAPEQQMEMDFGVDEEV